MKLANDYKKVIFIYVLLTLINVIWVISYDGNNKVKHVSVEKQMVLK